MTEKLDVMKDTRNVIDKDGIVHTVVNFTAIEKINELIDVVNALVKENNIHEEQIDKLQMKLEPEKCEIPADPYAEQRKWIGKFCKFWDNDAAQEISYGVLTKIDTESGFDVQYCCNDEYDYDACEPVKPDDSIIYKGE